MTDPVYFYSKTTAYHELSNFAPFGFVEDGAYWSTVEHYFQAQKFPDAECAAYREKIRTAKTPKQAKALGQTRSISIRADWEEVKDGIMLAALRKKFAARKLRELLLSTGDRPLVEASPFDHYWGCGRSGNGKNRLGELLMQTRAELRAHRAYRRPLRARRIQNILVSDSRIANGSTGCRKCPSHRSGIPATWTDPAGLRTG
jgi:ribA/ribD-fused uncharacterized protein